MHTMIPIELFNERMFSGWHDGPVYVLDTQCVHIQYPGSSTIICMTEQQVIDFLHSFRRPSSAVIYIFMQVREFVDMFVNLDVCKGLDVRLVIM